MTIYFLFLRENKVLVHQTRNLLSQKTRNACFLTFIKPIILLSDINTLKISN